MAEFHEIAGYEVLSTLGFGARSTIYAVRDPKRGDLYALKRVVKASPSDQRFLDQAIQEHEIARQFNHPALRRSIKLIKQRDFIRVTEVLVLMELVEGKTLEQHQPENLGDLVDICLQVAQGLSAMHAKQYVHADIKPNNLMATDDDRTIKIIDFGQSCPTGTIKQRIQGTPDYIAPEQVLRRTITPRTDIFNLGATMYWLLTGKHVPTLIPRGKAGINLRSNNRVVVPPSELNSEVPPALSSLVMDCIETSPSDRPANMDELCSRLEIAGAQLQRRDRDVAMARRNAG